MLSVRRYVTDRSVTHDLRLESTPVTAATSRDDDLYDVVLTDGASRLKCLLAPSLNSLVQQHRVSERR